MLAHDIPPPIRPPLNQHVVSKDTVKQRKAWTSVTLKMTFGAASPPLKQHLCVYRAFASIKVSDQKFNHAIYSFSFILNLYDFFSKTK